MNKRQKAEKKKAVKKRLKKTTRIILGVIAAVIAVLAVVFIVYSAGWLKDGTNTTAAVILLILAAGGIFADFKIIVKIKDGIFAERMDAKFGEKRNAPVTVTPEETKGLSESEIAAKICDAYRGESGGNSDADYRITYVNYSSNGSSIKFAVDVEITASWQSGADKEYYRAKGQRYAGEVEAKLRREITSTANANGLRGVSVTVSSKVTD